MTRYFFYAVMVAAASLPLAAQAQVFAEGNVQAGKALVQKHCIECHAKRFGGDDSKIYLRDKRIVNSARGLLAQIRYCNTMLGVQLFEDDELNIAAYLNQTYYHFEQ